MHTPLTEVHDSDQSIGKVETIPLPGASHTHEHITPNQAPGPSSEPSPRRTDPSNPKTVTKPSSSTIKYSQYSYQAHLTSYLSPFQTSPSQRTLLSQTPHPALALPLPPNTSNTAHRPPQTTPISPQITHESLFQRTLRHARPAQIAETATHARRALAAWVRWRRRRVFGCCLLARRGRLGRFGEGEGVIY